jgi:hypothetical protein
MYHYSHFQNHPVKTYLFLLRAAPNLIAAHFSLVILYPFSASDITNRLCLSNIQFQKRLFNQ